MGKTKILTKEQEIILDKVAKDRYLQSEFYFTGGTALSEVYLKHRYSEDLDFFTNKRFDNEVIFSLLSDWGKKNNFTVAGRFVEVIYIFNLTFSNRQKIKVDFSYYPYRQIEKGEYLKGIRVDSLLDIAINKLLTISQRTDVKDFVDLYFLLERFSVWDLLEGLRVKFNVKSDPFLVAADFSKVELFEYLPEMIKPLKLVDLKTFFRKQAKVLGLNAVKK